MIGLGGSSAAGYPPALQALTSSGQNQPYGNAENVFKPWYAALSQRATRRANVIVLGDSLTAGQGATAHGNRWVERLTANLRARLGLSATGGRGFICAANTGVGTFAWPAALAGGAVAAPGAVGPNRQNAFMNGAGQQVVYNLVGTSADIVYATNAAFGTFSWSVDGGAATNVVTNGSNSDGVITHVALGAAGAHTLTLAWVAGSVFLDGVTEYNGDETSGLIVHDCGHCTYGSTAWSAGITFPSTQWPQGITALTPDLLILALGTVDFSQANSPSYVPNMQAIAAAARLFLTAPVPIMLVAFQAQQGDTAAWQPLMNSDYAIAAVDPSSAMVVADLRTRLPNHDDTFTYGFFFDSAHPSNIGHGMIADALTNVLLPN